MCGHQRVGLGEGAFGELGLGMCSLLLPLRVPVVSDCDPVDCSPPGSSAHGILQARKLEGFATPSSRGSFQPRD